MSVWPHAAFSQRATWPPSATVRQCSIARITFSWSRLTWRGWPHAKRDVIAEDVRDLQSWSNHERRRYGAGGFSVSRFARLRRGAFRPASGLSILEIIPIATRV